MVKKFFLPILCVLLVGISAAAQSSGNPTRPSSLPPQEDQDGAHLPDEMRIRMEITRADEEYKKTVDDADKLSALSTEVARSFHDAGKLGSDDLKKVGSIEKLARKILAHTGGDEVGGSGAIRQKPVPEAIADLSAAADKIQKSIKQETRFVVSAVVIGNANEVIHLAQHIRRSLKAD